VRLGRIYSDLGDEEGPRLRLKIKIRIKIMKGAGEWVGLGCPSRYVVTTCILPMDFEQVRCYKGVTRGVTRGYKLGNEEIENWELKIFY
jgi:hypothetical protein